nr:PEPxxWA-CTERM sorting domain-containing protein [Sphingomonas sp. Leaf339]
MKKILAAALAATSMFAITPSAEAAVTVNFSFDGASGSTGLVTGKLLFNTTGTNVAASEVYILSAPTGVLNTTSANQNLFQYGNTASVNSFTVSESGIVTAAKFNINASNVFRTWLDISNSNNKNANQVFNFVNSQKSLNVDGFLGITFTPESAVTAVPEPATWAMMLVGFAMVGGAARYRRRSFKVTYA